jgi:hypothetical protein
MQTSDTALLIALPTCIHSAVLIEPHISCHFFCTFTSQIGDTVWVGADLAGVTFLAKFPGLELWQKDQIERAGVSILDRQFTQAAVSARGALVGRSVRDIQLRQKYRAAVVAFHREVCA